MPAKKPRAIGNSALKITRPNLGNKAAASERLKKTLAAVYDDFQKLDDKKLHARFRNNFIFHMVDWSEDLVKLRELFKNPERFDEETASQVISGFLYHVIPHLRAAGRLLLDYTPEDIFLEIDQESP
jgi:hypothetical protein